MYIVEGNIGVGKSTFLEVIKRFDPSLEVVQEPLKNWNESSEGKSLLGSFYSNPTRWAYTFETFTLMCRIKDHIYHRSRNVPYLIMERSVYSGHYCFAINDYVQGYLSELEWNLYHQWMTFFISKECLPPHGFIYLRTDPDTCFKRINKRARGAEQAITRDYLVALHERHEQFLIHKEGIFETLKKVPVLVLDCNESIVENPARAMSHFEQFQQFYKETTPHASPLVAGNGHQSPPHNFV